MQDNEHNPCKDIAKSRLSMILNAESLNATVKEKLPFASYPKPLSWELAFTDTYRKFQSAPIAQRESECLRVP